MAASAEATPRGPSKAPPPGTESRWLPVTTAAVDPSIASDELRVYPIITGEYSSTPRWERRPVTVGAPVAKPTPVFVKLDPCVVEEEMARMTGASGADMTAADATGDVAAAPAQGGAQA